ncbi:MAG: alpha/beta fold hydrolase [Proteobacteria bacterium]|nr:alpha/beta fold hydrolase [Pseudomonadota bacterium]
MAQQPPESIRTISSDNIARHGAFYVGGEYVGEPGMETMGGAMYVEVMVPKEIRHPHPIVFLHGAGQTGYDWLWTPDGRPGWAYNFLEMGYVVYLQDFPARGRSQYVPTVNGDLNMRSGPLLERIWTAPTVENFPQAENYTQWPGAGKMGDPIMDDFNRTQVQFMGAGQDRLVIDANVALLDLIGEPVILLTHSQGGWFGWNIADERPDSVVAIATAEPAAPPIRGVNSATVEYRDRGGMAWGVTNTPITYDPPISDSSELNVVLEDEAEGPNLVPCYRQEEPARQLANLVDIPVLFINGDGGYHRIVDHCLANWLNQAGVETEYVRLEEVGFSGNGHMMMLELNSKEIAEFIGGWLEETLGQ